MQRIILHIDFDSFFASVEQQYNVQLRGKPLGVTATNGRTCIIAASREAKKYGIKTGSRTFEAYKLCPSLVLISADFVKYWETSKKFVNICKDYSPYVEVFSIDEVFMDITATEGLFGDVYSLIATIKHRIKAEIGEHITVSVGISYNKLLAKLASGLQKPNGVVAITPQNLNEVYKKAQLTDICGIGNRICARLTMMGVYTLIQLQQVSPLFLVAEFGVAEAEFLCNVSHGIDDSPVFSYTTSPSVKSVGRNYCLPKNEYNQKVVLQNVYELCEEIAIKLRRLTKKARTVGISLRGNTTVGGEQTYPDYFNTGSELFHSLPFLARRRFAKDEYVRQIRVWVRNLEDSSSITLPLFAQEQRKTLLWSVIDRLNEKFGDHTIRNGFLLYADKLTTVPNGYMADTYERTKLAKESLPQVH